MTYFFISLFVCFLSVLSIFPQKVYAYSPVGNYLEVNGGSVKTNNTSSAAPSAVSFESWIYPTTTGGEQVIFAIGTQNQTPKRYEISRNGNSLQLRYLSGLSSQRVISAGSIPQDSWTHIAVSIAGAETKLSINGSAVYTYAGTSVPLPLGPDIIIGSSLKGSLDELRIFSDGSTYLLWHFDELRGQTIAVDSSGNARHGNLVGSDSKVHFAGEKTGSLPNVFPTFGVRQPFPTLSWPRQSDNSDNENSDDDAQVTVTPTPARPVFQLPTLRPLPTLPNFRNFQGN